MFSYLKNPFPFEYHPRKEIKFVLLIALFPGLFISLFKPFGIIEGIDDLKTFFVIFGFGLVTAAVVGIYTLLLPWFFKKTYDNFTLGRALIHYSSMILLIAVGNYFYKNYWEEGTYWNWQEFFIIFYRTLLLAVIPSLLILLWYQKYILKKHLKTAIEINQRISPRKSSHEFFLISDNQKEILRIPLKDLRYIESQDNYVMVYYKSVEKIEKKLIRSSLAKVEENLNDPKLIRCHRSYIVNLDAVSYAKGNSRGLQLEFHDMDTSIPVSRSCIQKVRQRL